MKYWLSFFKSMDCEYALENESKTMFGITYILHPKKEMKIVKKDEIFVIPLNEVVEFCKVNELSYRPALEYLDETYDLNLYQSYEHVH